MLSKEGALTQELNLDELANLINTAPSGKSVRLLSCNDLDAARELSKLTQKPFYASDGWVELAKDGTVYSEKPFVKLEKGVASAGPAHTPGNAKGVEEVDFVRLGRKKTGSIVKLTTSSSLSKTLFNQLDNALSTAPSIKFDYGSKALQSPKQFLNEIGSDMYDVVFSKGGYAKFDNATGRMLYSDGTNQYFVHYTTGNNVSNVEQLINTRVTQLRNCLGLNGPQTIQLTNGLGTVTTNPTKVTTFIGKTDQTILLKNQFGNFTHIKVGESEGAVNLLNMPNPYWNPATWFEDFNKDWMIRAIQRGDDIYIASPINYSTLINKTKNGVEYGSYFANELNELVKAGIKPNNVTQSAWKELIPDIIAAASKKL